MYQEHRLKAIRANWKFILLILKTMFMLVAICYQLDGGHMSSFKRYSPIVIFVLIFVLKHFIYTNEFVARSGATLFIVMFGALVTKSNLEITQFRLYEGLLVHISISFLLSTCLVSDWRVSSGAMVLVYANLSVMLKTHFSGIPFSMLYCIIFSLVIF
mmetsp:Transcript_22991/g.22837  ORF Transcript_22991/g.22837 Transcript_22991/m.22837 type:complete len:158 (+) Transcript_22991:144-617(+)